MADKFTDKEGNRIVSADRKYATTGVNTHVATQRGYSKGILLEEGDLVPDGVPVSDEWMKEVEGSGKRARAVREAQADHPGDTDLNALSKSALEAMAAERGVNVDGLTKADLIAAITAEREPTI